MDDMLFEKFLSEFVKEKGRRKDRSLVIDQKKNDEFMDSVEKLYTLFYENGLKSFEINNDSSKTSVSAHFYFDRFLLSGNKYNIFLLIIKDVDGIYFSSYDGMVEMTVSKNDVWKEDI